MATAPTDLVFIYTNHRGETAERRVVPETIRFASTQWHREPQWLLVAYDLDRGERRDFAWKDIRFGDAAATIVDVPADAPVILAMCRAHDREQAAQMGEPSPWDLEDAESDIDFVSDRTFAMREAFRVAAQSFVAAIGKRTAS
jgi:predicted DNA-binding transcriptional regulator YafY